MAGAANPAQAAPQPNVFQQSSGALKSGINAAQGAAQFQPQQVNTEFGYTPDAVAAQQAAGGIQTYMNPYTQQVIDTSMSDLERQRQMQMNQLGAQASAAGAFGGSRQGVAESLTNEAFARQGGQLAAGLRQQGFQTALGAAQQDVANTLQSDLANQAARAAAEQFGQSTQLQGEMANQAARARAEEFGQSTGLQAEMANQQATQSAANLRSQAAGQLGQLSNLGFGQGMDITRQQQSQGLAMQALNQQLIDAGRQQYAGFTGSPERALQLPIQAVSAGNMGQGTSTQTAQNNPGLFDYLSLGASTLGGFAAGGYF